MWSVGINRVHENVQNFGQGRKSHGFGFVMFIEARDTFSNSHLHYSGEACSILADRGKPALILTFHVFLFQ